MPADLRDGELVLEGRIIQASNATFLGRIGTVKVVYKPVAGERPLWDFPGSTLARREVAAYLVSESFGWDLVPRTWLRDGPFGPGMVQVWQQPDPAQQAVDLVPTDDVPVEGWCHVFDGLDAQDRPVSLIHEDSPVLRRMAVFDVVVNNADRKGGHVLEMTDGHRYGVDHGLTFHSDNKLRTVLWGWLGHDLHAEERAGLERLQGALDTDLGDPLGELISGSEIAALVGRCDHLLRHARFPAPAGEMPPIPWPPF
ncbi:SCO1664 family protein [Pseudactinotalea sp. Z1732]|uniref:SCO1664 family protein n=1 Tax=Pseudactinotalea sp. Z1732 TaxID=3413026 RepID=UPI003C7A224D